MFDARLRIAIDPALNRLAAIVSAAGISANMLTLFGACLVPPLVLALAQQNWWIALGLLALNRLADGLDGAVARQHGSSLWGGYLDSLCDYLFYVGVPVGFALADPDNLLAALLLVASFTLTAVSFLALAAIVAGRDLGHKSKAFTYTSGLMEGGETIAFFVLMCVLPAHFPLLAGLFAGLCLLTVVQRLHLASRLTRS